MEDACQSAALPAQVLRIYIWHGKIIKLQPRLLGPSASKSNVNTRPALSEQDLDTSRQPGSNAKGENPPQTTARNSQGLLLC